MRRHLMNDLADVLRRDHITEREAKLQQLNSGGG
jgi:hypothetical protein